MSINSVFGILLNSGVPFLNKQFGSVHIPFSVIGSLGGLFVFTQNTESTLLSEFSTDKFTARLRSFNSNTLLLIHVSNDTLITSDYISEALQHINFSIISHLGLNNFVTCQNADQLKTDLSSLSPLLNALFQTFSTPALSLMSYQVHDLNRPTKQWSKRLEEYLFTMDTNYGCVFYQDVVYVLSNEWMKLPFNECMSLLLTCAMLSKFPEKSLIKKLIHLPSSSPNKQFLLVRSNFTPFYIFAILPTETEDSDIIMSFNKIFPSKDAHVLIKDDLTDKLKFDPSIFGLIAMKNSESIIYISELYTGTNDIRKLLTYSISKDLVSQDLKDGQEVNCFSSINKNMNCHLISKDGFTISALFKPTISHILAQGILKDIILYFTGLPKK